jgi:predicted Zn-dependent protease with MMP-like domain
MIPDLSGDEKLILVLLVIALVFGLSWWWNRSAQKWVEQTGKLEPTPKSLGRLDKLALALVPQRKPRPAGLRYSEQEFQEMVSKVLDEVPEEFHKDMENLAVIISTEWPTEDVKNRLGVREGHPLFGSYTGLDRTMGFSSDSSRHIVTIYQSALELYIRA